MTWFLLGLLVGVVLTGAAFLVWTALIVREERRTVESAACTPEWCPLVIDTEAMTAEDIESIQCCSRPHESN